MEPTLDEDRQEEPTPSLEERAHHALHAYHERRRRRRSLDTYFGTPAESLVQQAEAVAGKEEWEHRRSELLEDAEEYGMSRDLAELLYDIALEEGLEPALALELARSGLAVEPPPEGISNESSAPSADPYLPTWMFPAEPTDQMLRERALRLSFRRFRGLLEEDPDVATCFLRFATQPDVGAYGY